MIVMINIIITTTTTTTTMLQIRYCRIPSHNRSWRIWYRWILLILCCPYMSILCRGRSWPRQQETAWEVPGKLRDKMSCRTYVKDSFFSWGSKVEGGVPACSGIVRHYLHHVTTLLLVYPAISLVPFVPSPAIKAKNVGVGQQHNSNIYVYLRWEESIDTKIIAVDYA